MKYLLPVLVLVSLPALAESPAEIKNGDFEKGKQFWRGNGKIETVEGGRVCELKASERYSEEITQDIDMGKATELHITMRTRGVQYKGNGIRVAMQQRGGGSTFTTRKVAEDGAWSDFKWTYQRNGQQEKYTLVISPLMGTGSIQIDDIKVSTAAKTSN